MRDIAKWVRRDKVDYYWVCSDCGSDDVTPYIGISGYVYCNSCDAVTVGNTEEEE